LAFAVASPFTHHSPFATGPAFSELPVDNKMRNALHVCFGFQAAQGLRIRLGKMVNIN
jgi:hypothetical protein